LTLRQLAGQRIVFGFAGPALPPALRERVRRGELAGVILFKRHIRSRRQLRNLVADLQAIPRPKGLRDPLLVMIDQEGGAVKRLDGAPDRSPERMGRRGVSFVRDEGRRTARNLRAVGVNTNLAPVLDRGRRGSSVERLDRAFSADPQRVGELGTAFARGLDDGGVIAAAKHFPGLGRSSRDEDFFAARIDAPKSKLRAVDEPPFATAARAKVPIVMMSTAIYPAFDARPALFSRRLSEDELRGRLGFRGVTITDDLEVPSVSRHGPPARRALLSARAGVDLLLFAQSYAAGAEGAAALRTAVRGDELPRSELERSAARVLALRATLR